MAVDALGLCHYQWAELGWHQEGSGPGQKNPRSGGEEGSREVGVHSTFPRWAKIRPKSDQGWHWWPWQLQFG